MNYYYMSHTMYTCNGYTNVEYNSSYQCIVQCDKTSSLVLRSSNKGSCRHSYTCKHFDSHNRSPSGHMADRCMKVFGLVNSGNTTQSGRCSVSHNKQDGIAHGDPHGRDDCIHVLVLVAKTGTLVHSGQPRLDHVFHNHQILMACYSPLLVHISDSILLNHHPLSWILVCNSQQLQSLLCTQKRHTHVKYTYMHTFPYWLYNQLDNQLCTLNKFYSQRSDSGILK